MTIRPGFSGAVPEVRIMIRTNFVPVYFHFPISFRLPDNILQNGDFPGSC
jgi:hypothetical protein